MTRTSGIWCTRLGMVVVVLGLALPHPSIAAEPCTKAAAYTASSDDRRTTAEVERRIATDEMLSPPAREVKVLTHEGVVTLHGIVVDDEERMVLASLAESAPGVRRVEDRLQTRR